MTQTVKVSGGTPKAIADDRAICGGSLGPVGEGAHGTSPLFCGTALKSMNIL